MKILLSVTLIAMVHVAVAQIAGTQYFMNSLPQYVTNNPAFMPKYKFALGLPGSMIDVNYYNNGFNYNDVSKNENGKRVATLSRLMSALPEKTYITSTAQVDLFRLGLKIGPGAYLSLNSSVRGYGRAMVPKDAMALVVNGNESYVGKTTNISPGGEMMMFWENAVGLAVSPSENLTVGARLKVLRGFLNVNTAAVNGSISVSDDHTTTLSTDMNLQTSGLQNFDDRFRLTNYSRNHGLAFDLGATFKPFDKLTVAASLVDLGAIKWKDNTYQYTIDKTKASYTFRGFDIDKLVEGESQDGAVVDSIKTKFKPDEKQGDAYTTALPGKAYISVNYDVMKNFSVGTVIYAEKYMGRVATGMTLGMNKHFGKVLSTSLSYTMSNRSFNNLGAGLSLNLAPLQIYVVGDNLLRMPLSVIAHKNLDEFINSTQVFTFRAGVNFVWGWTGDGKNGSFNNKKRGVKPSDKGKQPTPSTINVRKKKKR